MTNQEISARVEALIREMTPEEKVAQMVQIAHAYTSHEDVVMWAKRGAGSFLHIQGDAAREVQSMALKTRLGIPVLFGIDAVHGHCLNRNAAIFPSQLGIACSFDREMARKVAEVTAREVAADGLHWTFSPILCLGRDLRWGRVDETFGEDPYLAGELGAAMIRGYQGEDLSNPDSILACAKHYIAYGEAVGARDACDTEITGRKLREVFLPPFRKAAEAGCATVMTAYGSMDGTPFTVNRRVMHDILRDELGFDGFVVTDWDNVNHLVRDQHVYETAEEAAVAAAQAGNDMIMVSAEFYDAALEALRDGRLSEDVIDEAVRHILKVKCRMGLFEHPEKGSGSETIGCEAHCALTLEAARESAVLLKNEGNTLPLRNMKKIAVIGPNADDVRAQYGDWTYFTHPQYKPHEVEPRRPYTTILEGMRRVFDGTEIVYSQGCSVLPSDTDDIPAAVEAARGCDAAVLVLGDMTHQTGEQKDRADLSLSGRQAELFREIRKLGISLVLVLLASKPLTIPEETRLADAVIYIPNCGMHGGLAIAEILAGQVNPSGRMPISVPHHVGQLPVYYNSLPGWHGGKYMDQPAEPLFRFGEGLSYTRYEYGGMTFDAESLTLSVQVTNAGTMAGTETVQVYFRDLVSSVMTPVKRLIAFERVNLEAGETRPVVFRLSREDFALVNAREETVVEPGAFRLYVGHSSGDQDLCALDFTL